MIAIALGMNPEDLIRKARERAARAAKKVNSSVPSPEINLIVINYLWISDLKSYSKPRPSKPSETDQDHDDKPKPTGPHLEQNYLE